MENVFKSALLIIFSICLVSCGNDDDEGVIRPSVKSFQVESEGDNVDITLAVDNFVIEKVTDKDGYTTIFGETYSADGTLLRTNEPLFLEGEGRVEALWGYKGFTIIRNSPTTLKVVVEENLRDEDFGFIIVLKSGNETDNIIVQQKKTEGYTFGQIEYMLEKGDGDSIYIKDGVYRQFDLSSPMEISFSPFGGIDIMETSYFGSGDYSAFTWTDGKDIEVEVPVYLSDSEVVTGKERVYNDQVFNNPHAYGDVQEKLLLPAGKSNVHSKIEFRKRTVSYKLVLINNSTKEEKIVKGKWIEAAPTGSYRIEFE